MEKFPLPSENRQGLAIIVSIILNGLVNAIKLTTKTI